MQENHLLQCLPQTAFAFRGYNITNLGRTLELLDHPVYAPIVERHLQDASRICADAVGREVDLVGRVRAQEETSRDTYADALALVIATSLAQIELLDEHFGIYYRDAQLSCGYSLGEITALIAGGVFDLESAIYPTLVLADDAVALGDDVTMGIVFCRGPALDMSAIERLCVEITSEGDGAIGISSYLSPNTVLLLGQGTTVKRIKQALAKRFPKQVHLKVNSHHWPPIHTQLVRHSNISDRASVMLETSTGGFSAPVPPIVSCITGDISYNDYNARELMNRWIDHPQYLWDVIEKLLAEGVTSIIHVGPEPNIIPATMNRLSVDVSAQLNASTLTGLGLRAISGMVSRPWLTSVLSKDAMLLRAPFINHIRLEDWLLEHEPR